MAAALHSPKGMHLPSKKPKVLRVNVVYCFDNSSILICQNLDFRSRHKKWPAPTKLSSASGILSNGSKSFFMWALRWQKSMQKHKPHPSFEQTQQHYTTDSGWDELCLNVTSFVGVHGCLPPVAEEST